jgi:hypothetical protein
MASCDYHSITARSPYKSNGGRELEGRPHSPHHHSPSSTLSTSPFTMSPWSVVESADADANQSSIEILWQSALNCMSVTTRHIIISSQRLSTVQQYLPPFKVYVFWARIASLSRLQIMLWQGARASQIAAHPHRITMEQQFAKSSRLIIGLNRSNGTACTPAIWSGGHGWLCIL